MTSNPYITPELFAFFRDLRDNNQRDWFEANQGRYEAHVREPFLRFVTDFGLRLAEISPHYVGDARRGGSLFRIHRDIRFSRDKTPYKTAAGVQFRHESASRDVHSPGFYLHLEPDNVFMGAGLWRPERPLLARIRDAIVANPDRWQQALGSNEFRAVYTLQGDSLKKAPQGYDPQHPLIEDLKRTDFLAGASLSETIACGPDFMDRYAGICGRAAPLMAFLTEAVGLPW